MTRGYIFRNFKEKLYITFVSYVDSKDWMEGHTAERIKNDVLGKAKSGSIVLFHNAALNTPAALPSIIEKLQADGYTICKISELIYKDGYTINHKGQQIKKATENP